MAPVRTRSLILAAALAMSLSGCIGEGQSPPVLDDSDPDNKTHPNPNPTVPADSTGKPFCAFLDTWSAQLSKTDDDTPSELNVQFDPNILAQWGFHDLPPYGCHSSADPGGHAGGVTWYMAGTKFCDQLTAIVGPQLRSAGFSITDESGEFGSTVSYSADRGEYDHVDYQCFTLASNNIGTWLNEFKWPVKVGNTIGELSASYTG